MARKVAALEKRAGELGDEVERLEALRRELRAEIVPYVRGGELVRHADLQRFELSMTRSAPATRSSAPPPAAAVRLSHCAGGDDPAGSRRCPCATAGVWMLD